MGAPRRPWKRFPFAFCAPLITSFKFLANRFFFFHRNNIFFVCECARMCVSTYSKCLERLFGEKPDVKRTVCVCVEYVPPIRIYCVLHIYYIFGFAAELDMIENNYQTLSLIYVIYVTCEKLVATVYV